SMRLFMSYGCPSEGLKAQMFSRLFMSIRSGFSVCVRSTFTPNFEREYKAWLSHPRICVSFHSLYFASLITFHMPCFSIASAESFGKNPVFPGGVLRPGDMMYVVASTSTPLHNLSTTSRLIFLPSPKLVLLT